ncbi:MAG TPA: hypothetical protein VK480_11130 [Solirubrobacterales bacterium]|nr:hypothetical protein [Solirubrobacterales bacterium]
MTAPLEPEPLLSVLVDHQVAFIVVGGYAVAAHGFVRATKDIDICPDPAEENLLRLADALAELQAEPTGLDDFAEGEFDLKPDFEGLRYGGNWTLRTKHGRLDVMQHIKGLGEDGGGWKELSRLAVTRTFLGHECLFCSYEDLVKMKLAAGRPQDEVDVNSLKAARGEA